MTLEDSESLLVDTGYFFSLQRRVLSVCHSLPPEPHEFGVCIIPTLKLRRRSLQKLSNLPKAIGLVGREIQTCLAPEPRLLITLSPLISAKGMRPAAGDFRTTGLQGSAIHDPSGCHQAPRSLALTPTSTLSPVNENWEQVSSVLLLSGAVPPSSLENQGDSEAEIPRGVIHSLMRKMKAEEQ